MYGSSEYNEATANQAYQQQQLYEQQTQQAQQFELQQQQTLASYDQTGQYDQPPTPVNMVTRVRVTRSRVRAAAAAAAAAPPPPPPGLHHGANTIVSCRSPLLIIIFTLLLGILPSGVCIFEVISFTCQMDREQKCQKTVTGSIT